jgi:hypothetical protein
MDTTIQLFTLISSISAVAGVVYMLLKRDHLKHLIETLEAKVKALEKKIAECETISSFLQKENDRLRDERDKFRIEWLGCVATNSTRSEGHSSGS